MTNGNTETFREMVSRDSIIRWHFRSFTRKRARMRAWAADPEGPPILLLRHPRELEHCLRTWEESA